MRKHQPILICLVVLLTASCCSSNIANAPLAQPSYQTEATITVASGDHSPPNEDLPTGTFMPTSESACPPSAAVKAPVASRFDPVKGDDAIAYSDDGLRIVLLQTKSTITIHPLTRLGLNGVDRNFAWSPSGTRIAFLYTDSRPEGCAHGYLMVADLSRGEVRPLMPTSGLYSQPAWSPDSEWLAFTDEIGHLMAMHVSGGEVVTVSEQALGLSAPAWLDTQQVAYIRPIGGARTLADLVRQPLDGSTPLILLKDVAQLNEFALSADGKYVAYFGGALYWVNMQSGDKKNLGLEPSERLQWSPNGEYLIGRGGMAGIYLVQPQVSMTVTQMNFLGLPGSRQTWAPDSRQFAALIGPEDQLPTIGIYDMATRKLSELSITVRPPYELAWSTH